MFLFIIIGILKIHSYEYLNTSHVLIYRNRNIVGCKFKIFKYISCSYLSRCKSMHRFHLRHLNTSHVLIYLNRHISTSYQVPAFKYISCSYLSMAAEKTFENKINLNTSHVLIYRFDIIHGVNSKHNLNTSHVLIYPTFLRTSCFI